MTLELDQVSLTVGGLRLFEALSLVIPSGVVQTVMGPSGAGKSSLISFIAGALPPQVQSAGAVRLDGQLLNHVPIEARRIGVLYQDDLLFPHMTVARNLAFALPPGGARNERRDRVERALAEAELSGFGDRDPATLSGGQRARVSLMRALLAEPKALLLDEPFSKLDSELRARMRDFTFSQVSQRQVPALLVTHDPDDAPGPVLHLA